MRIETRTIGFSSTPAIRRHVEARVESALRPAARRVSVVTARLEDVNADRGGADKRCLLVAVMPRSGAVVAQATHADLYIAVNEAAARLRRSALRLHTRRVPRRREGPRRSGALLGHSR